MPATNVAIVPYLVAIVYLNTFVRYSICSSIDVTKGSYRRSVNLRTVTTVPVFHDLRFGLSFGTSKSSPVVVNARL